LNWCIDEKTHLSVTK